MEKLVIVTLEKFKYDAARKDTELKESCDAVLKSIKELQAVRGPSASEDPDGDRYFRPFQLACDNKNYKIKALALDVIEKMIAFGYLRGARKVKQANADRFLVDIVIESICSCRDEQHDSVQLQVIKALLTAISSPLMAVREQSLLLAVRAVYHIFLISRNAVNKNTAKATLRQMLNIVFQRMEQWQQRADDAARAAAAAAAAVAPLAASAPPAVEGGEEPGKGAAAGAIEQPSPPLDSGSPDASAGDAPSASPDAAALAQLAEELVEVVVEEEQEVEEAVELQTASFAHPFGPYMYAAVAVALGYGEPVTLTETVIEKRVVTRPVKKMVPRAVAAAASAAANGTTSMAAAGAPSKEAGGAAAAPGVGGAPAPSFASLVPAPPAGAVGPGAFQPGSTSPDAVDLGDFPSPFHRDAFLIFRALCRLSMKGDEDPLLPAGAVHLPGAGPAPGSGAPLPPSALAAVPVLLSDEAMLQDPVALQSKILALDLVLALLEGSGAAFRSGPRFIGAIKQYLCVGLLKNILSTIHSVGSTSLKLFLVLMRFFKQHIASEVEVFISQLFMRLLQSPHSSFDQKIAVLTAFRSIASDPSAVVEMFLNYDCAPGRQDLFEGSVNILAGIAQGRTSAEFNASQKTAEEAKSIRAAALSALSSILQSIVVSADLAQRIATGGDPAPGEGLPAPSPAKAAAAAAAAADAEDDAAEADPTGAVAAAAAALASPGAATPSASSALAKSYDEQKRKRLVWERAAVKFSVKPKKGIEYMTAQGLCDGTPASVASVLHERKDILDKTAIGEIMGEEKPFNVAILHAYVDQLDFTDITFDGAIRKFLSGFRIPGEAQKIDRMMEKFAERFCANNPGIFPSADTAFILSYSVIMLQTDAHNPNIPKEKKMTRAGFISNNRGIANGADLPPEFLGGIYDSIVATPISLREDDEKRTRVTAAVADEKQRKALQAAERAEIVAAGQQAMSNSRRSALAALLSAKQAAAAAGDGEGDAIDPLSSAALAYYTANDVSLGDHVKPMFEVSWAALLAVFSVVLETSGGSGGEEDPRVINACLVGFAQAIHVAGLLGMTTERDAFVVSLCKFTALEPGAGVREMRGKNVACTRAMLNIALNEGDRLGRSWGPVLVCVSQLARLIMMAQGGREDSSYFRGSAGSVHPRGGAPSSSTAAAERAARAHAERDMAIERANAALLGGAVDEADITRLYTRSIALSAEAIVDFVTQLCAVSLAELAAVVVPPPEIPSIGSDTPHAPSTQHSPTPGGTGLAPRIFSLQKVVEVADYNMHTRSRMVWARVWDTLSQYFTGVCCSPNPSIAMYAIDSLKQLSAKFLEKAELRSFHFQTKFLRPFLTLMEAAAAAPQSRPSAAGGKGGAAGRGAAPARAPQRQLTVGAALAASSAPRPRPASAAAAPTAGAPRSTPPPHPAGPPAPPASGAPVPSPEIRELILHVCGNLIRQRHGNIRSGWRTFMGVYAAAAANTDELLVSLAFSTVHEVLTTHFEAVAASGAFVDSVKCMVAFGSNVHTLFALRAIDHCATLGAHLARGRVPLTEDAVDDFDVSHTHPVRGAAAAGGRAAGGAGEAGPRPSSGSVVSDDAAAIALASARARGLSAATGRASDAGAAPPSAPPRSRVGSLSLPPTSGAPGKGPGDATTSPSSEWYSLDGPENADVVDDRRERRLLARLTPGSGTSNGPTDSPNGPEGEEADEALAQEDATDAAMLSADDARGGLIRRFSDARIHLRLWWPLLTGLARLVSADKRYPVRLRAMYALFAVLRRYGPGFSPSLWLLVYTGVLLPIFDDVRQIAEGRAQLLEQLLLGESTPAVQAARRAFDAASAAVAAGGGTDLEGSDAAPRYSLTDFSTRAVVGAGTGGAPAEGDPDADDGGVGTGRGSGWTGAAFPPSSSADEEGEHDWLRTTCLPALSSMVRLQTRFFTRLASLLPSLLGLIESCIDQEIEGLARVGVTCLRLVLAEAGPRFDAQVWDTITASLSRLFAACTPAPLLDCRPTLLRLDDASALGGEGGTFSDEEGGEEDAAAAEEEERDAFDGAAPAAPTTRRGRGADAASSRVSAWQVCALGSTVTTAYGPGIVLSAPSPVSGVAAVQLPWGVLYAHVPSAVAAIRTRENAAATAAASAAAAAAASTPSAPHAVRGLLPSPQRAPSPNPRTPAPPTPTAAPAPTPGLPFNSMRVVTQCVVQLELITCVGVLADAHLDSLGFHHVETLLELLRSSADFARRFNADRPLRRALWDAGFMRYARHNKLPSLLRQEAAATQQLIILLMRLYSYDHTRARIDARLAATVTSPYSAAAAEADAAPSTRRSWKQLSVSNLTVLSEHMVTRYTQLAIEVERARMLVTPTYMHAALQFGALPRERTGSLAAGVTSTSLTLLDGSGNVDKELFREAAAYGPLVLTLLQGLLAFDDAQFHENLPWLYPLLTGLIVAGNLEIRGLLASVFEGRFAVLLGLKPAAGAGEGAARAQ